MLLPGITPSGKLGFGKLFVRVSGLISSNRHSRMTNPLNNSDTVPSPPTHATESNISKL